MPNGIIGEKAIIALSLATLIFLATEASPPLEVVGDVYSLLNDLYDTMLSDIDI